MARAVQIASAPQKIASRGAPSAEEFASHSSVNAQEVTNRSASKTAAPSKRPSTPISSPNSVTVERSSAISLSGNSEVDETSDIKEEEKKMRLKLTRPRDAQLEKA